MGAQARGEYLRRTGSLGLIVAVLAMIVVPYAQGTSPCASILAGAEPGPGASGTTTGSMALPEGPGCNAETHASLTLAMTCAFCGATLLPGKLLPPAATGELRLGPLASLQRPQGPPSLPWRPPA